MMSKVVESGTGARAKLEGREVAGKTGTTSEARDAWFIGFTADYVTGVWMGYDDNTPLAGVTGGGLPAQIWHEVMVRVEDGLPIKPLPMIIPEVRSPPVAEAPETPVVNAPAGQTAAEARQAARQAARKDPITSILEGILGGGD